jgi:serine/threonine protein kinase
LLKGQFENDRFFQLLENQNDQFKTYSLVMEYADGGTLRSYLKRNFSHFTWDDKFNLACQLTSAVLCIHDGGIVHRDLVLHLF